MQKVKDILRHKGDYIESVEPSTRVIDALRIMAGKNFGSIVVMEKGKFLGIMTERDYSRKVILVGKNSSDTTVEAIMSTDLPRVSPDDTIEHCMALMNRLRIRYIPVYKEENIAGIISMTDVVSATIVQQKETISHLQHYISGSQG